MALVDAKRGVLVLRIVYDGPAFSGKTSSVRALAAGAGRSVTTPAELEGRTLFFDWVDYVAGLFEGRQIRCQIISAPGQLELQKRREAILATADAVVAVLDTRSSDFRFSLEWASRLLSWCRAHDPPLGLVVQANKRDAPDAIDVTELRSSLTGLLRSGLPMVQSSATNNEGIREAFVLAVRLALDRVQAAGGSERLVVGTPSEDTPEQLLARLRDADTDSTLEGPAGLEHFADVRPDPGAARRDLAAARQSSPPGAAAAAQAEEAAFEPDPRLPSGQIWPPVDGRALLHEVVPLGIRTRRTARADWSGSGSGFRFHSARECLYADPSRAREELLEWARDHATNLPLLSPGRAIVLAEAGEGRQRLWQIVRSDVTLRERLAGLPAHLDAAETAREFMAITEKLLQARERFASSSINLPCNLWSVSGANAEPLYVGLMPARCRPLPEEPAGGSLVARELGNHIRALRRSRVDYEAISREVRALAGRGMVEARVLSELFAEP